jgi:bifunctional DNA-binding transcriptional regulator/antitoxin component of YhaV-PrlF toxin-antitoxin module
MHSVFYRRIVVDQLNPYWYDSYYMKTETKVTSKGTTTIPEDLRKLAGITVGSVLTWEFRDRGVFARPKTDVPNAMQRHIRSRAGAWKGKISGVKLLKRTRS